MPPSKAAASAAKRTGTAHIITGARTALIAIVALLIVPSVLSQPPNPESVPCYHDSDEAACPGLSYCNDRSGYGGDCIACDAIPASPALGCYGNEFGDAAEACTEACSESWRVCTDDEPCPGGSFCTFEGLDEDMGYCFGCDRVPDPLTCFADQGWYLTDKGKESCATTCFRECAEDGASSSSCSGGAFCNFQIESESRGYCSECALFEEWSDCLSEYYSPLSAQGGESCANACFGCSEDNPCPNDWFCDYQLGDSGFCTACQKVAGNPMTCDSVGIVPESGGSRGRDSCRNTCFAGCSSDIACPQDSLFCDFYHGDEGHCASCDVTVAGDPFKCSDPAYVPASGEERCLDTCFADCSLDDPCLDGSFCTATEEGYCMDCDALNGIPGDCLDLHESEQDCLSSCFIPCTISEWTCQAFSYCASVSGETSDMGYCESYPASPGFPGFGLVPITSPVTSKFAPDIGPREVEEIITKESTQPATSLVQEDNDDSINAINAGPEGVAPLNEEEKEYVTPLNEPEPEGVTTLYEPEPEGTTAPADDEPESSPPFIDTEQKGPPLSNEPSLSTTEAEGDAVCTFCTNDDMQYSERKVRAFYDTSCADLKLKLVPTFASNTRNCYIAEINQYICGCSGTSYAGASTHTKQVVLAWLPRCMAIISAVGSIFIIADIAGHKKRRGKTFGQLMIFLSSFDLLASIAYSFTTLPTPAEDYIYGARGNEATCTAQGFFISMGTIACYTNVSLAFYYLLMLKFGWSENKIQTKARLWFVIVPIVVGFTFAFAGIPFYDSILLWCTNTSSYWPDIPVAVAIALATVVMGAICYHVHGEEKASAKWRTKGSGGRKKPSMASAVAWQSLWYLAAFYMVWPPYLALQYVWASGRAYDQYGFILAAGTVVPMQGFWNAVIYFRPRCNKRASFVAVSSKISNAIRLPFTLAISRSRATVSSEKTADSHPGLKTKSTEETFAGGDHALENGQDMDEGGFSEDGRDEDSDLQVYSSLFCSDEPELEESQ
mmetsp:Transcript_6302/g.13148  ORF Transcript_6302/g.13148 Transcript_6302/m.13148 type:complete len:1008 (+) Transcript_6302:265-3288(+)|eukprot:CAMPEP_0178519248 /NCGR_PEP_ID=MMETSP0696-20121128/26723_1 /TAXON_ID=265572 /ORGANISM="Extubocellulus spinifer, Strain CCMP396" /LENGTH=1007 /DNA_ID=CAMNT_0020149933 /DNA_START=217 /DNA_END=3240 /DNA_ORIENTATION=+